MCQKESTATAMQEIVKNAYVITILKRMAKLYENLV